MKNIFKSSKNKNSLIGALLAVVSLFSFNFTPISVISSKIVSAAKYEATETKITENTSSTQITTNTVVSNLKEYFSDSSSELTLSEYYESKFASVLLQKADEYLKQNIENYEDHLTSSNANLEEYFGKTINKDVFQFIYDFISQISKYSQISDKNDRLSIFYNDLENYLYGTTESITGASADGITSNTTDFYTDSISYKNVKIKINEEVKKTISIVSYDGTDKNKVAAIIANDAPSKTDYQYGSSYEKHNLPYLDISNKNVDIDTSSPFYFQKSSTIDGVDKYNQLKTLPYETNSNGTLVVYALTDGDVSYESTYDFLGYKSITFEEYSQNMEDYFAVPYSSNNIAYFNYLFKELKTNNKINDSISYDDFVDLFYTNRIDGLAGTQPILYVKYNSTSYLYNIYVSQEDFDKLRDEDTTHAFDSYKYKDFVTEIDLSNSSMKDYVTIKSISSISSSYKANEVGDVTLYVKNEIKHYTSDNVVYLTDNLGNYIYESELKLDIQFEKINNKKKLYVLDESKDAEDNKIYKALGFTVIPAPTIEYLEVEKGDENYSENHKLYYKYSSVDGLFAKNHLTISNNSSKNAIYALTTSIKSDATNVCKMNSFIPLSKDDLASGFFTKINPADPHYSEEYELYYKYDTTKNADGTFANAKMENKIYQYTSATSESEYKGFYKTDSTYNIQDYVKIQKSDTNFKQGFDLYYKKQSQIKSEKTPKNTTYYFKTKSAITFSKNSYYAISFYVNTSGENISASLELIDDNNLISDAKITNITTNGEWVKYYLFIATDLLTDSKATITMSMGTKDGIYESEHLENLTGSVLFDEVAIFKINETDFNKKTINNELVYSLNDSDQKVDNTTNNNSVIIADSYNARTKNSGVITEWNDIFNFDTIDSSHLLNSEEAGGNLQKVDISKIDGYSEITELWQYYIGRDVSGKNNSELLQAYRDAYKSILEDETIASDVSISIEDEIDEKAPVAEDESTDESNENSNSDNDNKDDEDDEKDSEDKYQTIISDTFNNNNKILKIVNNSTSISLGVVSKPFTLKTSECYKITLWIYTPDEDSTATIKVISSVKTALNNDYGLELSAGASDISAYLKKDDEKTINEYRWLPVEFYIQGNILADQNCSLVLLADANSTIYFDNIQIEKITTSAYTSASAGTRLYKLALTDSSTALTKLITNGFFNDATISDINADSSLPKTAQNWTITSDAAQDYVTAGIISSKNQQFIEDFNNSQSINNLLATNMYAINISSTEDIPTSNHKIYTAKTSSLSANSVYKVTFEFYYSKNNFKGDIISNLYYSSYKAENKISSIRTTVSEENADKWNSITFYVATGTTSVGTMLELGVENASGTIFIRNVYATTISDSLSDIRSRYATDDGNGNLIISDDKVALLDFSSISQTMNQEKDEDGLIESTEYTINSSTTTTATSGKSSVVVANYFNESSATEKTVIINETTYYVYDNNGTAELYKYPIYANTSLENNEKVTDINKKSFIINNNKVIVGSGINETEYEIIEQESNSFTYFYNDDFVIGNTTINASELKNNYSNNILVLSNDDETDYTDISSKHKISLSSSSYYALKFYVKTSDFENEDFGLSINVNATNLNISWNEDLINTTKVDSTLHKDENGFVCYQLIIATKKSSYNDLIIKFSLGDVSNTGKGYAIISKVELTKFGSEDEFNHYNEIFVDEENDFIVKSTSGNESSTNSTNNLNSNNENTWATFFYIFSSLLLFITLVIAMVAVTVKKHPIKHKVKITDEDENFDVETATKTKEKITKEKESKDEKNNEGGIE